MLKVDGVGERLREERERLGLNQTDFGVRVGVSRGTQKAYELGSGSPDLRYLAALESSGANVTYVLTGQRHSAVDGHSSDEIRLLDQYRLISDADREAVSRIIEAMATVALQAK